MKLQEHKTAIRGDKWNVRRDPKVAGLKWTKKIVDNMLICMLSEASLARELQRCGRDAVRQASWSPRGISSGEKWCALPDKLSPKTESLQNQGMYKPLWRSQGPRTSPILCCSWASPTSLVHSLLTSYSWPQRWDRCSRKTSHAYDKRKKFKEMKELLCLIPLVRQFNSTLRQSCSL